MNEVMIDIVLRWDATRPVAGIELAIIKMRDDGVYHPAMDAIQDELDALKEMIEVKSEDTS